MLIRAEAATSQTEPTVDSRKAPADPLPLLWQRQYEHALCPRGSRTDELSGVGIAADDPVHDDEIMRWNVLCHEVSDAPLDFSAGEQVGSGLFVAAGELDIRRSRGAGFE